MSAEKKGQTERVIGERKMVLRFLILAVALAGACGIPRTAVSQGNSPVPIDVAHHKASEAYFRLFEAKQTWQKAREIAHQTKYHGRQGRLAIIDTPEKHQFVLETFDFGRRNYANIIWIGLRYWCSFRALMWVNGNELKQGGFSVWTSPWYRSDVRCGQANIDYMGVYYNAQNRWQAAGQRKLGDHFLVEYPTS